MKVIVCYHYPCPDGIFAALAAYLHCLCGPDPDVDLKVIPLTVYGKVEERLKLANAFTKEHTVYLVDFTGGADFIAAACQNALKVIVLDHHKSGQEDLAAPALANLANLETHFDMNRSGATIARDYFKLPTLLDPSRATAILKLFDYIEDNDLWRHKLPDSKLFSAGLNAWGLEFDIQKSPRVFDKLMDLDFDKVVAKGREVIEEQDRIINAELETSFTIAIPFPKSESSAIAEGEAKRQKTEDAAPDAAATEPQPAPFQCLAVVTTHPDYRSTQGNRLADKSAAAGNGLLPAGAVVYVEEAMGAEGASKYKVSLRSIGDVDTTAVSKAYGGGGHKNASSFIVDKALFDSWRSSA